MFAISKICTHAKKNTDVVYVYWVNEEMFKSGAEYQLRTARMKEVIKKLAIKK